MDPRSLSDTFRCTRFRERFIREGVFTLVVSIPAHTSQNRLSRYLATLALFCDVTVCLVEIAINGLPPSQRLRQFCTCRGSTLVCSIATTVELTRPPLSCDTCVTSHDFGDNVDAVSRCHSKATSLGP
ncbi:hypothetical protein NP493_836g01004 [Ridgeia piscesae]|uniref:Uncharacterized protein n=1 Tax=Ridgeia piscesae TaxID=27915 RepID=A0AAD9KMC8_RIDPI|nr:hypothetical protein NP493_836g01004 [Ridgeia piscesae]